MEIGTTCTYQPTSKYFFAFPTFHHITDSLGPLYCTGKTFV